MKTNGWTVRRTIGCLCLAAACPAAALSQSASVGGPLTGPPVLGAPFSADATTIVQQTPGDGTRIERHATARYFRDGAGRVRVEQTILALEALGPNVENQVRTTICPNPAEASVYTLDPKTRTASTGSRSIAALAVGGGDTFSVPLGGPRFLVFSRGERILHRYGLPRSALHEEALGNRQIDGIDVHGRRVIVTIPVGQIGNDRPIQVIDERWESAELQIVVYSRNSDPRTGAIEYRLSNIRRSEPSSDLFVVPADYTIARDKNWMSLEYAEPPRNPTGPAR